MAKKTIGIVGARGHTGAELIRLIAGHPDLELAFVSSRELAGQRLDPAQAKVMLCGNPDMLADARKLLGERGFKPGRRGIPGNLAVENYW